MSRHLPDVNVLLALVWARHQAHAAAHAWFSRSGRRGWATNPLTQLGVLRLLTNPAVTQGAVSAATALSVLTEIMQHPGHEFWPLDREPAAALASAAGVLRGHRQWTDALLLWHAASRDGVLVTFDTGIGQIVTGSWQSHLLFL